MSKLNIYRLIVIIGLAVFLYTWSDVAVPLFAGWIVMALCDWHMNKFNASRVKASRAPIRNYRSLGALDIWLGIWNGFYVWKDLDHGYHRRNREGS
ncbi:hypothetical protein [Rhizobium oryzicola]|uniref:Uncharacterized protein n=1 Tax=Rhizobium oryzicola TaxID=1232668 RepID=A0ABT8SS32_9HYPH|nr:hypothetical protein [Rhizobium oryzicola]MDO1580537.1 hypothetical protein [Rhizobium oryzicola]